MSTLNSLDIIVVLYTVKDIDGSELYETTYFYDSKKSEQEIVDDLMYQHSDDFIEIINISR